MADRVNVPGRHREMPSPLTVTLTCFRVYPAAGEASLAARWMLKLGQHDEEGKAALELKSVPVGENRDQTCQIAQLRGIARRCLMRVEGARFHHVRP